jgi:hypothetical protein
VKRGLVFNKKIYLLEKEDDYVDENQAAQAQAKDFQIFPDNILMKNAVALKYLQKDLSTFVE